MAKNCNIALIIIIVILLIIVLYLLYEVVFQPVEGYNTYRFKRGHPRRLARADILNPDYTYTYAQDYPTNLPFLN